MGHPAVRESQRWRIQIKIFRKRSNARPEDLLSDLLSAGWKITASVYDANFFGNWYVDLKRGNSTVRLVKDRSQYMIAGPPTEDLREAGLWTAFDSFEEFRRTFSAWALER
jgi:hypothetical protein